MPIRLRDLERKAKKLKPDIVFNRRRGKGSHLLVECPGYRSFPLPAGKSDNTELSDRYVKRFCKAFEFDVSDFI